MAGTWLVSYIFLNLTSFENIVYDYIARRPNEVCPILNEFYVLQAWNLGPSKVETAMIDIEIPHQLKGPNGEQIFMQVFEPQVS
jgi:hypothetical protein